MKLFTILYILLICPLELLFEVIFYLCNSVSPTPGLTIAALSVIVSFLVLPLYSRADAIQAEERDIENRMSRWVDHIKKTFKGDERFMMLQTYYRQNDYKPVYVFRSLLPLLLQVPFFIAAYRLLSQIKMLHGVSFGPIRDLGAPDGLLTVSGFSINLLPFIMTMVNILSGMIYLKGTKFREKLQLYGVAFVFLILLYNSPSGLVFYWTCNNIFSLVRNSISRLKDPRGLVVRLASAAGFIIIGFAAGRSTFSMRQRIILAVFGMIVQIPMFFEIYKSKIKFEFKKVSDSNLIFFLSAAYIAVLTGGLIPSAVIKSSTLEFVSVANLSNPANYLISSISLALGTFVLWVGIFFFLADDRYKVIFSCIVWTIGVIGSVNYLFFGTHFGILSPQLQYDMTPSYTLAYHAVNIAVLFAIGIVCIILAVKIPKFVVSILISGVLIGSGMSVFNTINIVKTYNNAIHTADYIDANPTIMLSRDKKNVVLIMMDKMVSYYVPYLMNEDPKLYEAFDGFVYYPNSVSFGYSTNAGSPALFGGYDYIPKKMNERDTELLVDKHNEALKVLPVLYEENGYDVTVCDASLANYSWIPDMSIYDDYPEIRKYLASGTLQAKTDSLDPMAVPLERNLFCYGIFRAAPSIIQPTLYNLGNYNAVDKFDHQPDEWNSKQVITSLYTASGMDANFMSSYSVLDRLGDMTRITDDDKGGFLMLANKATHDPQLLQLPDYSPIENVDNTKYGEEQFIKYDAEGNMINIGDEINNAPYQCTMASMKKLGEWFDYLKSEGVYDNTRIIVVSDHATGVGLDDDLLIENYDENGKAGTFDALWINCTLMVKDFNAKGFKTDDTFMTNADVPTIATNDTIEDPHNPFTGNKIENSYKSTEKLELMGEEDWSIETNNGYKFKPSMYYSVHDDIFVHDNWSFLGFY